MCKYAFIDTNELIIRINKNEYKERFYVSDLNIFEFLKGKDEKVSASEFSKLDKFVNKSRSEYLFRSQYSLYQQFLKDQKLSGSSKLDLALELSKKVFVDVFEIYYCLLVSFVVFSYKAVCEISNFNDLKIKRLVDILAKNLDSILSDGCFRDLFFFSKNDLDGFSLSYLIKSLMC